MSKDKPKEKDRLGTGFKRVYFVLCGILALLLLMDIRNHYQCLNGPAADLCWMSYGEGGLSSTIFERTVIFLFTIPIYYIIRWVYLGFKKK